MKENNKKLLEITLVLVSNNTFDIEIYEPESGEYNIVKCHDNENTLETENQQIIEEIRSKVNAMREECKNRNND